MPTFSPATIPAFVPGLVTAADLNTNVKGASDDLRTKFGSRTSWTPVLTAASTNPTNYTAVGEYILTGDLMTAWFSITGASGFTVGSGIYALNLPAAAVISGRYCGTGRTAAGSAVVMWNALLLSTTALRFDYANGNPGTATVSVSHSTGAGVNGNNILNGYVTYPVA